MNIENDLQLNNNLSNEVALEQKQNSFLDSLLGKAINSGLDFGIKALLPDFIEDQVINIKDNLLNYGLKDGISKTIEDAINIGKSAIGIITGSFEDVSQMQSAIQKGGLIDSFSKVFDVALNEAEKNDVINSKVAGVLKEGKNSILNSVENNVENKMNEQQSISTNLDTYISKWKEYFDNQDFDNMDKQFKKIKKELKNLVPLEKSINEARTIENLHTLIKNNGHNFDLTETEQELIKKLS